MCNLTASITARTEPSCNGGFNGTATVTASGGTLPYTYSWVPTGGVNSTATGLSAGIYTITVTDANGCTVSDTVNIDQPAFFNSISQILNNDSCNGECNATFIMNTTGGTPPYNYFWTFAGHGDTGKSYCAGTYAVKIVDSHGCKIYPIVTITQPSVLYINVQMTAITDSCNGKAWATVYGGTPSYTYLWSPGGETSDTIANLCNGNYCCRVNDQNGCVDSLCLVVTTNKVISESWNDIHIFPVPAQNRLFIQTAPNHNLLNQIEILDIAGRIILTKKFSQTSNLMELNISSIAQGFYFLKLNLADGSTILKKIEIN